MMLDVRQLDQRDLPELRDKVEFVLKLRGDAVYNDGNWIIEVETRHWKFAACTHGIDFEGVVYDGASAYVDYYPNLSDHPHLRLSAAISANGIAEPHRYIDMDFMRMIYEVIQARGAIGSRIEQFERPKLPTAQIPQAPQGFWRRLSNAFRGVFS